MRYSEVACFSGYGMAGREEPRNTHMRRTRASFSSFRVVLRCAPNGARRRRGALLSEVCARYFDSAEGVDDGTLLFIYCRYADELETLS